MMNNIEKKYTIVKSDTDYNNLVDHVDKYSTLAFDTETTGVNVRKDLVIGLSICGKVGESYYLPIWIWDKSANILRPTKFRGIKTDYVLKKLLNKELLMWNASFDVRVVKNNLKVDLIDALLADIMLMKHTVEEEGEFSLKGVAIQYQKEIGLDMDKLANEEQVLLKENVKANGGKITKNNFEMFKADLDVLGVYACADADLTLRLAFVFREKLEKEGLESFFYDDEVMPLYKEVTIVMEDKGIALDLELMKATEAEITRDMNNLKESITKQLVSLPEVTKWMQDKARESFPVSRRGSFGQIVAERYSIPFKKLESGKYSITEKELNKVKTPEAEFYRDELYQLPEEDILDMQVELFKRATPEIVNISSKSQMADIIYNYMGVEVVHRTEDGNPQFNDEVIETLKEMGMSWASDLSNYNKLVKIKSTYIERFLEVEEDGIFYPTFFQHRTVSGRYGSDMQQLSRAKEEGELPPIVLKYNNIIRKFFVSRKGKVFIDDDYESLEPHVFCHISSDDGLKDIFRKGHDFYSTIAIATEKLSGVSADKKDPNYLGKKNKPKRQAAKAYSLGIPYGLKEYALSMTLGISTDEAKILIDGYLDAYPNLKKWMKTSEDFVKKNGYIKTETGRIRHLPKVKELYKKHGDNLLDFKYRKKLTKYFPKEEVDRMYSDYKNGLNNAKNVQIQGLAASIVNRSSIAIAREFKRLNIDANVCLNVHDQIVVECPEEFAEVCKNIVQNRMENTYKISVDLKAPAQIGRNLLEAH